MARKAGILSSDDGAVIPGIVPDDLGKSCRQHGIFSYYKAADMNKLELYDKYIKIWRCSFSKLHSRWQAHNYYVNGATFPRDMFLFLSQSLFLCRRTRRIIATPCSGDFGENPLRMPHTTATGFCRLLAPDREMLIIVDRSKTTRPK